MISYVACFPFWTHAPCSSSRHGFAASGVRCWRKSSVRQGFRYSRPICGPGDICGLSREGGVWLHVGMFINCAHTISVMSDGKLCRLFDASAVYGLLSACIKMCFMGACTCARACLCVFVRAFMRVAMFVFAYSTCLYVFRVLLYIMYVRRFVCSVCVLMPMLPLHLAKTNPYTTDTATSESVCCAPD